MKQDELKCYVVETSEHVFYTAVLESTRYPHFFHPCNTRATDFISREELEINLQLKFPGCRIDKNICFTCCFDMYYEINGIEEDVLRECVNEGKPLL